MCKFGAVKSYLGDVATWFRDGLLLGLRWSASILKWSRDKTCLCYCDVFGLSHSHWRLAIPTGLGDGDGDWWGERNIASGRGNGSCDGLDRCARIWIRTGLRRRDSDVYG